MFQRPLLPAFAWALLILVLCLMPGQALPEWEWADLLDLDKPVHAVLFGVFFVLLAKGLRQQERWPRARSRAVMVALLMAVAYGALTELMQELPALGRRGDPMDLLANVAGVLLGLACYRWMSRRVRK